MQYETTRPGFVTEEHLVFLDVLQKTNIINMWGATSHIESEFPGLSHDEAKRVLTHWMRSFAIRQEALKESAE